MLDKTLYLKSDDCSATVITNYIADLSEDLSSSERYPLIVMAEYEWRSHLYYLVDHGSYEWMDLSTEAVDVLIESARKFTQDTSGEEFVKDYEKVEGAFIELLELQLKLHEISTHRESMRSWCKENGYNYD